MTPADEELEAAHEKALAEYHDEAGGGEDVSRYFFWAGVEYGKLIESTKENE